MKLDIVERRSRLVALLCCLLCVLLCMGALLSCGKEGEALPDEGGQQTPEPPAPGSSEPDTDDENSVTISNVAEYTVLRSDLAGNTVTQASVQVMRALKESVGIKSIATDWSKDGSYDPDAYEILIGETNRAESAEALAWAEQNRPEGFEYWYYIGVIGNKIVLTGPDEIAVFAAARHLMEQYISGAGSGAITLPKHAVWGYDMGKTKLIVTDMSARGKKDVFVADVDLSDAPYFIDNSGENDVTDTINQALAKVAAAGGGTVYLPAGLYRISDSLTLSPYVTLRGEYVDPDKGDFSDGTVLLLSGKGQFKTKSAVVMAASSMVQGLTFYYEEQRVEQPIPYTYTIGGVAATAWEVRDCTLLNSWDGLTNGPRPNGMITIDNVKGTVLHTGFDIQQRADISIATDLSFSPTYWAAAGEAWGAPDESAIRALMKTNGSVGLYFGDCDRDTYEDILLDGFATGIYNAEMTRAGSSFSIYRMTIKDATVGIDAYGVDTRYGWTMANCHISASEVAVRNGTDLEKLQNPAAFSYINLLNSTVNGAVVGRVKELQSPNGTEDTDYDARDRQAPLPSVKLFDLVAQYGADNTGKTDVSALLQQALNDAKAAGGGIVYLPAGHYLLSNPVTVNDNTQLRGCHAGSNGADGALRGTVILATHGRGGSADDTATVTVEGNNAGVTGMVVIYPENGVSATRWETVAPVEYSYFIRCRGKGNYASYLGFIATSRAVHFSGCSNFIADRLLMTVYDNGVRATDCYGGLVTRIHTNATYHTLGQNATAVLGEDWFWNAALVYSILDNHITPRMVLFLYENSDAIQQTHAFHYGAKNYMHAKNSSIAVLNGESARIGGKSFVLSDSELWLVNFMRPDPNIDPDLTGENTLAIYNFNGAHKGPKMIFLERD
ncbi:MAG: hypothetical protein IJW97_05730 [Clostridia bacterium]|nr:hypothetical protein [Clostridia bacterium]